MKRSRTWDLTKRFGPARSRVGHHGDVVPHITEVLWQSNACNHKHMSYLYRVERVWRCRWWNLCRWRLLLRRPACLMCWRLERFVSWLTRFLLLLPLLTTTFCVVQFSNVLQWALVLEFRVLKSYFWEISQHFRHLVSSLTTAHVDDDVTVGILRQGLTNDGLSAAERTRYSSSASLNWPIKTPLTILDIAIFLYLKQNKRYTYGKRESRTRWPVRRG